MNEKREINLNALWSLPVLVVVIFLGLLSIKGCEQRSKERNSLIEKGMVETQYGQWVPINTFQTQK